MAHLSENTLKLQYNLNSTLTSGDITPRCDIANTALF
jgi:hypothetical protein